ncbi:MAG: GAF domain-containing protein [SAR324 cluster bacterium]|nr:GAF domain-containing protein [SAR324 cluster bacterium]
MDQLCLALPHSLERLKASSVINEEQPQLMIRTFASPLEIHASENYHPLIIVLRESEYKEWIEKQADDQYLNFGIILLEEESSALELEGEHRVLAWIDPGITQKRWNFVLLESIKIFEQTGYVRGLEEEVEYHKSEVEQLHEIGIALSAEKSQESLLELIIVNSMELTHADGGSLYLIEEVRGIPEDPSDYFKNKRLRFEISKNDSRHIPFQSFVVEISKKSIYGYVALTGQALLIDDAYFIDQDLDYSWGGREFDIGIRYRTKSMLTVPMFDNNGTIIGVVQLINCKKNAHEKLKEPESILEEVTSFTAQHAKAIQSIASQAAVAIQNKRLVDSIQILFDGLVNASVKAIESRDPTTSGHSSRVAALTVGLAEAINSRQAGVFAGTSFTTDQIQEMRYASLLHDFGKIGVREEVLVKSKKLYPHEQQAVADRFKLIRKTIEADTSARQLEYFQEKSREEALSYLEDSSRELADRLAEIDDYIKFIIRCNEPTVLAQGGFEKLHEFGDLLAIDLHEEKIPFLRPHEVSSLSVPKGSLNEQDRLEIESHVIHTYKFLSVIPWIKNLKDVAKIAYAHHEKIDGTGYPLKLKGDEIPLQSKMMTIADIYDALTAWDRPYKKSIPAERALNILEYEAKDQHIDKELLNLFIEAKLYMLVARPE